MADDRRPKKDNGIPQGLYKNFIALRGLAGAIKNVPVNKISDETINVFEQLLNKTIPNEHERMAWRVVRSIYFGNKTGLQLAVKKSPNAAFLLWTEPQAILHALDLFKVLFIRWDREQNMFKVSRHRAADGYTREDNDDQDDAHPAVRAVRKAKPKSTNQFAELEDLDNETKEDTEPPKANVKPSSVIEEGDDSEDIEVADDKPVAAQTTPKASPKAKEVESEDEEEPSTQK